MQSSATRQRFLTIRLVLASLLILPSLALADDEAVVRPLVVGAAVPPITLLDQHDVPGEVPGDARVLLFSRSMTAAKILEKALADNGPAELAGAKAIVVSDIARMPGLVTRLIALPAMRRRSYRMLLDREGTLTASYPSVEDQVTWIRCDGGKVTQIEYFDSVEGLQAALRQLTGAASGTPVTTPSHGPAE